MGIAAASLVWLAAAGPPVPRPIPPWLVGDWQPIGCVAE